MAKKLDFRGVKKWRPRDNPYRFSCDRCGAVFSSKRKDAQFCSPGCRKIVERVRAKYLAAKLLVLTLEAEILKWGEKARPQDRAG